jgi:hypothetical protein
VTELHDRDDRVSYVITLPLSITMLFSRMTAVRNLSSSVLSAGFRRRLIYERPTQCLRFLSSTFPRRAVEGPKVDLETMMAFKKTTTFQKLSKRPEAVLAVQKLGEALQKHGSFYLFYPRCIVIPTTGC